VLEVSAGGMTGHCLLVNCALQLTVLDTFLVLTIAGCSF